MYFNSIVFWEIYFKQLFTLCCLLLIAKKTAAAGTSRKKAIDLDSSSDFDFGASKPKKKLMPKAAPKPKATKPKAAKTVKKAAEIYLSDSSDESGGKKKPTHVAVCNT